MQLLKIKTRWFPALMNLIGLGIAFSIFLILLSQVWWDFRYDRFKGGKDVYIVETPHPLYEGKYDDRVLRPLIPMIVDSSPDIVAGCDFTAYKNDPNGFIRFKDAQGAWQKAYGANYANTETSVLDVFNVTLVEGRKEDFVKAGDALISESAAKTYFPNRNPIGEIITYLEQDEYRITGIYKDRQQNETMINGFLLHEGEDDMSLPNHSPHRGYFKLAHGADLVAVREAVAKVQLVKSQSGYRLTQIHESWFEKDVNPGGYSFGGNRTLCLILLSIAVLFLLIAGFNYVNFAMAAIPFRIRDINTRKVFGSSRGALILRQLVQALVLVGAAYLIGVLAMKSISGTQWGTYLSWNMTPEKNTAVLWIGAAAALVLAILAGLAPALYSTSFQPALVLKGSFALSAKGGGLRTVTTVFQFVLSFIFLICAMMLQRQTSYMVNNNQLGFDHDYVLKMESHMYTRVADVAAELKNIPGVVGVTRGESPMVQHNSSTSEIREGDRVVVFSFRDIFPEYPEFFHLQLADGRMPQPGEEFVALINESFHEALPNYEIGSTINQFTGKREFTIIGILKNFNARTLENDYSPLVLFVHENYNASSFMMRIEPNADAAAILDKARNIYHTMKPRIDLQEIETGFLDEDLEKLYEQETRQTRLIRMSSILSLIITLIGILGLVWLDSRFMRKEIAIRKVNGATLRDILTQIGWKYLILAGIGFVIAAPIALAICRRWLEQFAFRTTIPVWIFVLAFVIVICITLVTVVLQAWRAASANPTESLKTE
ncbi:MAG: ABC transporter permease [Bacteroidales bacterium]|nr:ABC transporter permease [Bacteroidales bacterium]